MSDENLPASRPPDGEFLLYQMEDGTTRIECRLVDESLWLSQKHIAFSVINTTSLEWYKKESPTHSVSLRRQNDQRFS